MAGLDLMEISSDSEPPVCKIIDYGKYKYQKQREERKQERADKYTDTSSGLELFASGGIASGPPPEKGPQSQGLAYLMKNGKR